MTAPKTLPRSWWANSSWRRGGAQLVDDDLHRLGNVNHYPGRPSDFGRLSLESLRRNIRGWWDYHVNTRGWSDIGYQTAIALIHDGPVIVDLRGIGRVPAAHASGSNPRANWHGGATLWLIGNTEPIDDQLQDAYRWYRDEIWLPRWPTATGVTHHRRVPGAQTRCAGDHMDRLVRSGTLKKSPQETGMATPKELLTADGIIKNPRLADNPDTSNKHWQMNSVLYNVGKELLQRRFRSPWLRDNVKKSASLRWLIEWTWYFGDQARQRAAQARDEARANGKQIGELAAQVSALASAVEQLSAGGIDLGEVERRAKLGAEQAWANAEISVMFDDPSEPDETDADDE